MSNHSFISFILLTTVLVFTAYYWTATFHEEVKTIRKGRVTGATVMFVLNRYIGLLSTTLGAARDIANLSSEVCDHWFM